MQRKLISRTRKVRNPARSGLTLLEIMMAFALLVFSFTVLITTFYGAGRETPFTSEHFTAMFLAQKVIEDINGRVQDNPHFFTELIRDAEGEPLPVVNGQSKYFRLLENTKNFNRLLPGEDLPIVKGDLFAHFKPFKVQVSTHLEDPITKQPQKNMVALNVVVTWTSKEGFAKEYKLNQLLYGTNDDLFREPPSTKLTLEEQKDLDRNAVLTLANLLAPLVPSLASPTPGKFSIADIMNATPGGDAQAVIEAGRVVYLLQRNTLRDDKFVDTIIPIEAERDKLKWVVEKPEKSISDKDSCLRFVSLQKQIGALYEQKALNHISHLLMMRESLPNIEIICRNPQILGKNLSLCTPFILGWLNTANIAADLSLLDLSSAEKCFLTLVNPPILAILPRRKEPRLFQKILDVQKVAVLKELKDGEADQLLRQLHENIDLFNKKFYGQHPNFTDYLNQEKILSSDLKTIRENYSGLFEVFKFIGGLSDYITEMIKSVPRDYTNPTF